MEIGKIIKEERKQRELTQEELANEFFVSRQLISKWETGKSYPDLEQLLKLSDFFDLTLDELMRGDKKMVATMSMDFKKRKMMMGMIVLLLSIIISMGYYNWTKQILFLKPEEVEIVSINQIKIPEKTIYDPVLKIVILIPEDIRYQIHLKSKKGFTKITSAEVFGTMDIDDPNIYVSIVGNPSIFSNKKSETLSIESDTKIGYEANQVKVSNNKNKSIRIINIESYINTQNQLEHSWSWIEKETLESI